MEVSKMFRPPSEAETMLGSGPLVAHPKLLQSSGT